MAGEKGFTLWFTGLSGAGKTTISQAARGAPARARLEAGDPRRRHRPRKPLQGPRLLEGGPRHQHPPDRLRRRPAQPQRRAGDHRGDLPLRGDPRRGARADGRPLHRGLRQGVGRHLRRARRQGPLRESLRRRDQGIHRRLRPLRGPGEPGRRLRHRKRNARGVGAEADRVPRAARPDPGRAAVTA